MSARPSKASKNSSCLRLIAQDKQLDNTLRDEKANRWEAK